jgi:predicted SprT family Zn-dependent metalloprotease
MNKLTQIEIMAHDLIKYHCPFYQFQWDNGKRRYGYCNFHTKTISISKVLAFLNSIEASLDTILHEISHALSGFNAGHGPQWKQQAQALGCNPTACYDSKTIVKPPHKYEGICPKCQKIYKRFRKSYRHESCGVCCPSSYNPAYILVFKLVTNVNVSNNVKHLQEKS